MFPQENAGSIYGTVADPSGSVIANATVTVNNAATGMTRTVTTGSTGLYELRSLPIGKYAMTVSASNFQQATVENIILHIADNLRYDINLKIGQVRESVTVTTAPPVLQKASAEVSDVIEQERVVDLPLNRREYITLALLSGGTTDFSGTSTISARQVNAPLIMVAGERENFNTYRLNGVPILSVALGTLSLSPSIDSINEFKVITTGAPAEYGLHVGGEFLIATKSGANTLHGTAYEFLRNDKLDAKNFLDNPSLPIPKFRRNQFGLALGGPIIKNKTFGFANYEGLRQVQAQTAGTIVPSVAFVNGDFSALLPSTQLVDPFHGGAPYSGNLIPSSEFNSVSEVLLQRMPAPNRVGATNFTAAPLFKELLNQLNFRIDHQLSKSDNLWGSFSSVIDNQRNPFPAFQIIISEPPPPGFGTTTRIKGRSLSIHEVHLFGSNLINDFHAGWTRTFFSQTEEDQGRSFGIAGTTTDPSQFGSPEIAISGFASLGASAVSDVFTDNLYDYSDSLTWVRGRHALKFGGEFIRLQDKLFEFVFPRGVFIFSGKFTGNSFADFLIGLPTVGLTGVGSSNGHNFAWWDAGYVQDEWHVTQSLTLNLGLRYNYFAPWDNPQHQISGFDTSVPGARLILGCDSLSSCPAIIPGFLNSIPFALAKDVGWPRTIREAQHHNFAPRVAFAWSAKPNLVVRGGYAVFYAGRFSLQSQGGLEAPPFQQVPTGVNINMLPMQTFLPTLPIGLPSGFVNINRDGDNPMSQQRFLGIQYSPWSSLMVEAQYLGSLSVHLDRGIDLNAPAPGTTPLTSRVPFPKFGTMGALGMPLATANYNAMILRAVKRYSHGLTFEGAWTWSDSIDDSSLDQIQSGTPFRPQDSRNLRAEKGNSDFDQRHLLVLSRIYDLPVGNGSAHLNSGVLGAILGYWKTGNIVNIRSGQSFTVNLGFDNSGVNSSGADRPNYLCNPNTGAPHTASTWINGSCFSLPPAGTFGTAGRNVVTGPPIRTWDFMMLKGIPLYREATKLEFRAEFFNIFNHPNFLQVNRIFGSPGFGAITRVDNGRQIQFGLKLYF
jgi:hypothetical protein